ncbi:MAG TPA: transposase [Patescibacteria group bacterium]|nr:transposase [Patescibacteria group bacterium]
MPRPPRFILSQSYYHIITRGNNRNVVFKTKEDYLHFLDLINKYKKEHLFDIYHYCLMPNHVHFLIQTKKAPDFSIFMKKLNLAYFHYFKKRYGWTGHFWQGRFKSQPIGKDEYFIQCGKYIELNPVRARLVKSPEKYRFSSYNHYAQGQKDKLLTDDFFCRALGDNSKERQTNYQRLMVDQIIKESYNKDIWGSDNQRYLERQKINRKLKKDGGS